MLGTNTFSLSVREARSQQGCEIVSIDWLIRSLENLEPIDTKEFLLDFPSLVPPKTGTTTESAQAGKKRKFDDELRSEDGPSKKPKDITPAEFSKWAAIVEEEFRVKGEKPPPPKQIESEDNPFDNFLLRR